MRIIKNFFLVIVGGIKHKMWVAFYMGKIACKIFFRGLVHDSSKFTPSEMSGFMKVIHELTHTTYGSEKYKGFLRQIKPSVELHYKRNSHHAEHHKNGFNDMTIYDKIEMLCDWKAAIKRHKDGDIERSFKVNKERYKISDELIKLLRSI